MLTALTPVSNTVLHRFVSLAPHTAVTQLNTLRSPPFTLLALLYATHTESPFTFLAVRWSYVALIALWNLPHCPSQFWLLLSLSSQRWLPLEVSLSLYETYLAYRET